MRGKAFFDTNVLIYAVSQDDPRGPQAEALLATGGVVSVRVLNEFVSVTRRKMLMPWDEVRAALDAIRVLCPSPISVSIPIHEAGLRLAEKYSFGIYDALVAAAALEAGCQTLYSEDFQDGQIIVGRIPEQKLTIRNPFPR